MNLPNRKYAVRAAALFIALIFTLCVFPIPSAAESYKDAYSNVLSYLGGKTPSFGSPGGEWIVFTMSRSGKKKIESKYFADYCQRIEDMLTEHGSAVLHARKSTENSRLVIALSSIGRDAGNFAGFDLAEPLRDYDYAVKQGVTGAAFALVALNCNKAYGGNDVKSRMVDLLLSREAAGGGWSLMAGGAADPDVTSIVIYALAPYSKAKSAINRAVAALSSMQNEDGGFENMGNPNAESNAQVITALSTIGINAGTDERFVKNGKSVVDALLSFVTGKGFSHLPGGKLNAIATEQAAYSLCAYDRFLKGKKDIFDLSDVKPYAEPTEAPTEQPTQTPQPAQTPQPTKTPSAETTDNADKTQKPSETPEISSQPQNGENESTVISPSETGNTDENAENDETVQPTSDPSADPDTNTDNNNSETQQSDEENKNGFTTVQKILLIVLPIAFLAIAIAVISLIKKHVQRKK